MFWMASMLIYEEASVGCWRGRVAGGFWKFVGISPSNLVRLFTNLYVQSPTISAVSFSRLRAPPPSPSC
jgi:hypothetical protein